MISFGFGSLSVAAMTLMALALPVLLVWLLVRVVGLVVRLLGALLRLSGGLLAHVGRFLRAETLDYLHLAGGLLTGAVLVPLALVNLCIGRVRSAAHFGRALGEELTGAGLSLYRVALGNPIRLLGLTALTEGLERRLPDLVTRTPRERPRTSARPVFEGYKLVGDLEPGGSGAQLFLARPDSATVERYRAAGHANPGQVVIKAFALARGSTLPQIVRESRSLEAARKLGLVLDHDLSDEHFWYAMPFVPGDDLDVVTRRLHARCGASPHTGGLDDRGIARVIGFAGDLLATLSRFHRAGLWHKDIKPSNLIVSGDRVHLVDLGLVTPLASAMTLTTHGTEYFRDPELVRMALKGVKVHEVDGVKFDLYSAGAVLFSMIENSFPAQGNLSRIEKRCPDALAWIVRRSMADLSDRYGSAEEMASDLAVLLAAENPFAVRPADLPSMGGAPAAGDPFVDAHIAEVPEPPSSAIPTPVEPLLELLPEPRPRPRRRLAVLSVAALFLIFFAAIGTIGHRAAARSRVHWATVSKGYDQGPVASSYDQGPVTIDVRPSGRSSAHRTSQMDLDRLAASPRVLILTGSGIDPEATSIRRMRSLLKERGHQLVGEGDDSRSIELIARARNAAGLATLDDPDALGRLQRFLETSSGVDALLWLGPSQRPGHIGYRILVRGGV